MSLKQAKILFISYYCHPQTMTATRNYYLSQFLAEAGHEVHIISRELIQPSGALNIFTHAIKAWDYRKILMRLGVKEGVTSTWIPQGHWIQWGYKLLLRYPYNKWLGEGGGFYYLQAVKKGLRLVEQHQITHLFSSYRPMSDHFIAEQIKLKYPGLIWIGDFRDVLWWEKNNIHYQESWIRKLIPRMDHITAVTQGIGAFWADVFHRRFTTVYNGLQLVWDQWTNNNPVDNKFILNYTGRIYIEFQHADILLEVLKSLVAENETFANDVLICYSGLSHQVWETWMKDSGLLNFSRIQKQVPVEQAWGNQARAQINLVLTWTTRDITGFIHGKFNEYLAMRKPILCLIDGGMDHELEMIYSSLTNSLLAYNRNSDKQRIRDFIWNHYTHWKATSKVEELSQEVINEYQWAKKGLPLLELINKSL